MIVSIAAGVAMMANNNEDSPLLWGAVTFVCGIIGSSVFGFLGALIGGVIGAGIYIAKNAKYG